MAERRGKDWSAPFARAGWKMLAWPPLVGHFMINPSRHVAASFRGGVFTRWFRPLTGPKRLRQERCDNFDLPREEVKKTARQPCTFGAGFLIFWDTLCRNRKAATCRTATNNGSNCIGPASLRTHLDHKSHREPTGKKVPCGSSIMLPQPGQDWFRCCRCYCRCR
jgi:hypothetical protein